MTGKPWMMTNSIAEIEQASQIVLIASDPYQRQPILNLRIKKVMKQGAKIYIVNSDATELDRFATLKATIPEHSAGAAAKVLLKYALSSSALTVEAYEDLPTSIKPQHQPIPAPHDAFVPTT